jgi:hypothetical protein
MQRITLCKQAKDETIDLVFAKPTVDAQGNVVGDGFVIARLKQGSLAAVAGLAVGDRILSIGGQTFADGREAARALREFEGDLEIVIAARSSAGAGVSQPTEELEPLTDRLIGGLTRALSFGRRPAAGQAQPPKPPSFDGQVQPPKPPSFDEHVFATFTALSRSAEEGFQSALCTAREVYDKASGQHRIKAALCVQRAAHRFLAKLEARLHRGSARLIQARARGVSARAHAAQAKASVLTLQAGARGLSARRVSRSLRAERLAADAPKQSRIRRTFSFSFGKGGKKDTRAPDTKRARVPLAAAPCNSTMAPPESAAPVAATGGKKLTARRPSFGFGRRSAVHS